MSEEIEKLRHEIQKQAERTQALEIEAKAALERLHEASTEIKDHEERVRTLEQGAVTWNLSNRLIQSLVFLVISAVFGSLAALVLKG